MMEMVLTLTVAQIPVQSIQGGHVIQGMALHKLKITLSPLYAFIVETGSGKQGSNAITEGLILMDV